MKVVTSSEMRQIDTYTIEQIGIPGIILMENAAIRIVQIIANDIGNLVSKNIVVFAGKGNNGGDALAVSRHLYNLGANVLVVLVAEKDLIKEEAKINLNIVKNIGIKFVLVNDESYNKEIEASLYLADVIVDGLLEIGIKGEVNNLLSGIINLINKVGKYVISIDIPSGINGDTGKVCGKCIIASKTAALGLPKIGVLVGEGAKFTGEIEIVDIGIPNHVIQEQDVSVHIITREEIMHVMPIHLPFSHKGDHGKVLVIAGSTGLTGAATLTSRAAIRSGAGLVTLGIPSSLNAIMEAKLTEIMTLPLADDGRGYLSAKCIEHLESWIEKCSVVAIGPGLGCNEEITKVVSWLVEHSTKPLVIDADGINSLSENIDILNKARSPIVLTPHLGEMSKLTNLSIETIHQDKVSIIKEYSEKWNCTIVLKDWRTLVGAPNGKVIINTTGNAGMATGGSGDVLTGIIASFVAQGLSPEWAAISAVYIHGKAGDLSAGEKGQIGMIAGDIVENIPHALKEVGGRILS